MKKILFMLNLIKNGLVLGSFYIYFMFLDENICIFFR